MCTLIKDLKNLSDNNIVYFYIKEGTCLYVGKTKNIAARHRNHFNVDEYAQVSDILLIYTYKTFLDASMAEIYYINANFPEYNKKDKDKSSYYDSYKHRGYIANLILEEYYYPIVKEELENSQENSSIINSDFPKEKDEQWKGKGIYQIHPEKNIILNFFETQKAALESINKIGHSGISDAINERDGIKTHYAYGYRWYYGKDLPFEIEL